MYLLPINQLTQIYNSNSFCTSPNFLFVQFGRYLRDEGGDGYTKNEARVQLKESFSLSPQLFDDPDNVPNGSYHLCGVVNHIGDSPRSGHYTACVRKGDSPDWTFFDDAVGVRRSFEFVQETSQSRCYLALYELKENQ